MITRLVGRSRNGTRAGVATGRRATRHFRLVPSLLAAGLATLAAACAPRSQDSLGPTTPPERLWSPSLQYPPEMYLRGIEGEVLLQGIVDSAGRVDPATIRVLRATDAAFEGAAIAMLRGTRFRPAEREGEPTSALIEVPISFELAKVSVDSIVAADHLAKAERLIRRGQVEDAMTWFTAAQTDDPRLAGSTAFWFPLCWYGTLWDRAADVLSPCDELVSLAPEDAGARRARGMARAVTGDYQGAIEDFEAALRGRMDVGSARTMRDWIAELRAGRNPITSRVLEGLRGAGPTTSPFS